MKSIMLLLLNLLSLSLYADHISKNEIAYHVNIPNPIVIEAGAHIGTDSVELAKLWPQGRIFAFEPVPKLFNLLKSNTSAFANIICIQKALSNKNGEATMFISQGNIEGSSSLLKPKEHLTLDPSITFPYEITVPTITLDDWAKSMDIDHVDFLWLDMQGAEPLMLKASPNILKTVKVVYTEVSFSEVYEGVMVYPQFKAWMEAQGFTVVKEDRTTEAVAKYGNVLFCRK